MSRHSISSAVSLGLVIVVGLVVALVLQWQVPEHTLEPIAGVSGCNGRTVTVQPASTTVADDVVASVTCGEAGVNGSDDVTWLTQLLLAVACIAVVLVLRAIASWLIAPQKKVKLKRVASGPAGG